MADPEQVGSKRNRLQNLGEGRGGRRSLISSQTGEGEAQIKIIILFLIIFIVSNNGIKSQLQTEKFRIMRQHGQLKRETWYLR